MKHFFVAKLVGILLLSIVTLLAIFAIVRRSAAPSLKVVAVSTDSSVSLSFATMFAGQTVDSTFLLKNDTNQALNVNAVAACGCTSIEVAPTIKCESVVPVQIRYNSSKEAGLTGPISRTFDLMLSGPSKTCLIKGTIEGTIVPSIEVDKMAVQWSGLDGDNLHIPVALRLMNHLAQKAKISVIHNQRQTADFQTEPDFIVLEPGSTDFFTVTPPQIPRNGSYLETLLLEAQCDSSRLSPMIFRIELLQSKSEEVIAVPGSLLFTSRDLVVGREFELRFARQTPAVVKSVLYDKKSLKVVAIGNNKYHVDVLPDAKLQRILTESIQLDVRIGSNLKTVTVPVVASFVAKS